MDQPSGSLSNLLQGKVHFNVESSSPRDMESGEAVQSFNKGTDCGGPSEKAEPSELPFSLRPSARAAPLLLRQQSSRMYKHSEHEIVPSLNETVKVMECRKSIRAYRGTSEPTRPGLTWGFFLLFIVSSFWLEDLSGIKRIPPDSGCFEPDISESGAVLWINSFGFVFDYAAASQAVDIVYAVFATLVLVGTLLFGVLVIRFQVYYRLIFGQWIVIGFVLLQLVGRFLESSMGDNVFSSAEAVLILPFILIYISYMSVILFLWHSVPDLQFKRGWFLPKMWSHRVTSMPRVIKETIREVYHAGAMEERWGSAQAAIKIKYSSFPGRLCPAFMRKAMGINYLITYSGEVDEEGRPHGYGEWNDTHKHGEVLQGWWKHGVPAGPFRSRESGSGAGFSRLLVPYFRNRTDGIYGNNGSLDHGPINCGVLQVECCVAGVFFREYPKVTTYYEVPPSGSLAADISEVMRCLIAPPDLLSMSSITVQADLMRGLVVSSHRRPHGANPTSLSISLVSKDGNDLSQWDRSGTQVDNFANRLARTYSNRPLEDSDGEDDHFSESAKSSTAASAYDDHPSRRFEDGVEGLPASHFLSKPFLEVDGWKQCGFAQEREALVFITGFNASTDGSAKILAQMLALGNFPAYLKPFIYSWPGGSLLKFGQAQIHGAEAERTSEDLKSFLLALGTAGIRTVHLMTHSMGGRVLTAAIPKLEEVFGTRQRAGKETSGTAAGSESLDATKMLLSTVLMLNPEVGRHEFVDCYARRLSGMCPCISLYADAQDQALFGSELMTTCMRAIWPNRRSPEVFEDLSKASEYKQKARTAKRVWWEYSVGRISKDLMYADGSLVDIDVIQTTHLGANVQSSRHNAFNLNRELVDDLRDVIVNKQRAYQRNSRLQYRGGNRYNFLVAPTYVVNN